MAEEDIISLNGESVSLADIAGLDMSDVQEYRGFLFPIGTYRWGILEAKLDKVKRQDQLCAAAIFKLHVKEVLAAVYPDGMNEEEIVGKEFTHTFAIQDIQKDLGRIKAFLVDVGVSGKGGMQDLLNSAVDHDFIAPMKQTADKNDKDVIYCNLVLNKIKPAA